MPRRQVDGEPRGTALQAGQVGVDEAGPAAHDPHGLEDRLPADDAEVVGAQDRLLGVGQDRAVGGQQGEDGRHDGRR